MYFIELGVSILVVAANYWLFVERTGQWCWPPAAEYVVWDARETRAGMKRDRYAQWVFGASWLLLLLDLYLTYHVLHHLVTIWGILPLFFPMLSRSC